jgi:hypothetical protein
MYNQPQSQCLFVYSKMNKLSQFNIRQARTELDPVGQYKARVFIPEILFPVPISSQQEPTHP